MSRIFTWEQIRENHIPTLSDFDAVEHYILNLLENSPAIIGGVIIGSVSHGTTTIRSDIDLVILYRANMLHEADTLFQKMCNFALEQNVPLELIMLDDEIAQTPFHHLDATLVEHITEAEGASHTIKCEISPFINQRKGTEITDTTRYISRKMSGFHKRRMNWSALTPEERLRLLGKALDFPVYAARKVLRCQEDFSFGNRDTKKEVIRSYCELFPSLGGLLMHAKNGEEIYACELDRQIISPNEGRYLSILQSLEDVIPLAQNFARENLLLFSHK